MKSRNQYGPKVAKMTGSLLSWFAENARDLPWRQQPNCQDPYSVYVSEIMLQQTQVKTVIPYWIRWMQELPTLQALANAPSDRIHKLWEGLGYYTRVRNMQTAARIIMDKHEGVFPRRHKEILELPGIGRYTAGAICSIAYNQPTPILDGNVIRVLTRIFGISGNPKEKTANAELWNLAEVLVATASKDKSAARACSHFNQSLMELGALVCTPREPQCLLCPVRNGCVAFREKRVHELPNLGERTQTTERRFAAFIVQNKNRFLVRQRPSGVVNAHLWEFPNIEIHHPNDGGFAALSTPFQVAKHMTPLCRIKHSITRYRITLEAFPATLPSHLHKQPELGIWQSLADLNQLAFTSAHKKILNTIQQQGRSLNTEH